MTIRRMEMAYGETSDRVFITITFAGLKSGLLEYHTLTSEETGVSDISTVCDDLVEAGYTFYGITPP